MGSDMKNQRLIEDISQRIRYLATSWYDSVVGRHINVFTFILLKTLIITLLRLRSGCTCCTQQRFILSLAGLLPSYYIRSLSVSVVSFATITLTFATQYWVVTRIETPKVDNAIWVGGHMYPKENSHAQRRAVHSTSGWMGRWMQIKFSQRMRYLRQVRLLCLVFN